MNSNRARAAAITCVAISALMAGCSTNSQIHELALAPTSPKVLAAVNSKDSRNESASAAFLMDGHFYTAGYIAYLAGYTSTSRIQNFSCFTQTPDADFWKYNAVPVAVYGILPPFWGHRCRIMDSLHSLHGGNNAEVVTRRTKLKKLISDAVQPGSNTPDWQIGFLIHAFGDSYAHVKGNPPEAYGPAVGHGYEGLFGNEPDAIFYKGNHERYIEYVNELFDALASGATDSPPDRVSLKAFTDKIREEAAKGDDVDKRVTIIIKAGAPTYDWESNKNLCKNLDLSLDNGEVRRFLKDLSATLHAD